MVRFNSKQFFKPKQTPWKCAVCYNETMSRTDLTEKQKNKDKRDHAENYNQNPHTWENLTHFLVQYEQVNPIRDGKAHSCWNSGLLCPLRHRSGKSSKLFLDKMATVMINPFNRASIGNSTIGGVGMVPTYASSFHSDKVVSFSLHMFNLKVR